MSLMGRGRTHAVATFTDMSPEEAEDMIKEDVTQKMNMGMTMDEIQEVEEQLGTGTIDGRQVTREHDVNVMCRERNRGNSVECVVAVDDVPWF